MYISKDVLNHYLVHSSAFNCLKSDKKRSVFFILHFGRHADGGGGYSSPWLRYWPPLLLESWFKLIEKELILQF